MGLGLWTATERSACRMDRGLEGDETRQLVLNLGDGSGLGRRAVAGAGFKLPVYARLRPELSLLPKRKSLRYFPKWDTIKNGRLAFNWQPMCPYKI